MIFHLLSCTKVIMLWMWQNESHHMHTNTLSLFHYPPTSHYTVSLLDPLDLIVHSTVPMLTIIMLTYDPLLQLKYTNSIFSSTLLWSYLSVQNYLINWRFCSKHNVILWYYYSKGNEIYTANSWSRLENNYCMVKIAPSLKTHGAIKKIAISIILRGRIIIICTCYVIFEEKL